jgi:hypothetical protein
MQTKPFTSSCPMKDFAEIIRKSNSSSLIKNFLGSSGSFKLNATPQNEKPSAGSIDREANLLVATFAYSFS